MRLSVVPYIDSTILDSVSPIDKRAPLIDPFRVFEFTACTWAGGRWLR